MTTSIQESKTLWVGDVETWMDESYIKSLFQNQKEQLVSVKVIRDKATGLPSGYGFAEFASHEIAQKILNTYNGTLIPGTSKTFRLNWAVHGGGQTKSVAQNTPKNMFMPNMPTFPIYVGDLDQSVTDQLLLEFFSSRYKTVAEAKVVCDAISKQSKGYGFVNFNSFEDSQRAISEMAGTILKSRPIKTSQAFCKKASDANYLAAYGAQNLMYPYTLASTIAPVIGTQSFNTNTTTSNTNDSTNQIIQQQQQQQQQPQQAQQLQQLQQQSIQPLQQQQQVSPYTSMDYNTMMQSYMQQYMQMAGGVGNIGGDMSSIYSGSTIPGYATSPYNQIVAQPQIIDQSAMAYGGYPNPYGYMFQGYPPQFQQQQGVAGYTGSPYTNYNYQQQQLLLGAQQYYQQQQPQTQPQVTQQLQYMQQQEINKNEEQISQNVSQDNIQYQQQQNIPGNTHQHEHTITTTHNSLKDQINKLSDAQWRNNQLIQEFNIYQGYLFPDLKKQSLN